MSSCEVTKNCRFRRTQIDLTPIEVKDIVLTAHLKLKTKTQRGLLRPDGLHSYLKL